MASSCHRMRMRTTTVMKMIMTRRMSSRMTRPRPLAELRNKIAATPCSRKLSQQGAEESAIQPLSLDREAQMTTEEMFADFYKR